MWRFLAVLQNEHHQSLHCTNHANITDLLTLIIVSYFVRVWHALAIDHL